MKKYISLLWILVCMPLAAQSAADYNRSGVEKVRAGNYDAAIEDFNKALGMADVNAARVYHNIGISYERQGNLKKAAQNYDEAVRRNPKQLQSYERGGYTHYKLKNYTRAVELGKEGMKLDPDNRSIPKWLNKAYDNAYKEEKKDIMPDSDTLEYGPEKTLTIGIESVLIGAISTSPYGFSLESNPGLLVDVSSKLYVEYIHDNKWGGRIVAGNPYYGALLPETLAFYERFEFFIKKKNYYLGGGILGSHYSDSYYFGSDEFLTDIKLGAVYGLRTGTDKVDLYWYPRFLPSDTGYGDDFTFDTSLFGAEWIRAFNRSFDLYGALSMNEFYFFNNLSKLSHYDGTYDFSGGCIFNNRYDSLFTVYLYLTERIYMKNYNNDKPYKSLNGQGFFGLDAGNWFKGEPFSGIHSFSHTLNSRFVHNINRNFSVYEKIGLEFCGTRAKRHDITLWIGVEGGY